MSNTQAEETDGDRVRRLMSAWADKTGQSQAAFAKQHNMPGGSSMISQHKANHRPIGLDHARAYIAGFGCQLSDLSPTLAASVDSIEHLSQPDTANRVVSDITKPWQAVVPIKGPPPTLAQCIEVLALHLNRVNPSDKDSAKNLLNALVGSPALHANVAAGLDQLCNPDAANAATG